ncbi:restriction endonuclease subunit S [Microvirga rosea]|uniref:restriction endonuclease subunit S n=1 Tax=Microvirga rosea TaxID=2715425 RepID=UPI001D0ACE98|nr:restriction endonuclease subunit S [Microvirga rosea]MCB8820924.1 restriction endonuclease subunit S [Microvirga rosea]
MSFPRYRNCRDSGVEWLGELPDHWTVKRLKQLCDVRPSNVDKKTHDGEVLVRLCNYTDVYYSDVITPDMGLMEASASAEQVDRFTLKAGDVIVTKDSETSNDIAIAAYVPEAMPGVVCGYHLALIRPNASTYGEFIKRFFDSAYAKSCFAVRANGLTRVGLSQYSLDNVVVPTPPSEEQVAIATFLSRETGKIDALVEEQKRLIALLKEKRRAAISHAVTKGLDPSVPMKDAGIDWLGNVPEHWELGALKRFVSFLDGKRVPLSSEERSHRSGRYPYYGASGIIDWIDEFIFDEDLILVSEDGANLINRSTPISFIATGQYWVNNHAHILRPHDGQLVYWSERIEAIDLVPFVTGSAQPKLTIDALANLPIAVPPSASERDKITSKILSIKASIGPLIQEAEAAIMLLQERRSALISAAVTGKIDVRGLVPDQAEAA